MRGKRLSIGLRAALTIFTMTVLATSAWAVNNWNLKVLHYFNNNGTDGFNSYGGLIFDAAGNLYGTTTFGGIYGGGTVFELTPTAAGGWTEQVLYSFSNGADGAYPHASLIFDAAGNLYGMTAGGGGPGCNGYGCGTAFELTPAGGGSWTEQVLHSFNNNYTDGVGPRAGLIFDAAGNLYGTTFNGGTYNAGTVFELTPTADGGWTEIVLYSFSYPGTDGTNPFAGLIFDAAGNLYGTTAYGGTGGYGTVFELTLVAGGGWTEKVLHNFNNSGTDGTNPSTGLIFDAAGNLYGTTGTGGTYNVGTVFELTPIAGGGWTEKVLHNFNNGTDGTNPSAGLIFDAAGNLYGTTNGASTVFKLTPTAGGGWTETVLYSFKGTDGVSPYGGLIFDAGGNLYGTTPWGGTYGYGTVFELTPVYPCIRCSPQ